VLEVYFPAVSKLYGRQKLTIYISAVLPFCRFAKVLPIATPTPLYSIWATPAWSMGFLGGYGRAAFIGPHQTLNRFVIFFPTVNCRSLMLTELACFAILIDSGDLLVAKSGSPCSLLDIGVGG
jgi:hypothetical protein